jgi:predicted CoA-binding protein
MLAHHRVIAVVGMSSSPAKDAHTVPLQLARHGWKVIPVNPHADTIAGLKVYRWLADIPEPIDLVVVFRPSDEATDVVRQAIAVGAKAVWLQEGIVSPEGRRLAAAAGVEYVEDLCTATIRSVFRVSPPAA